jgi:hypothetical protein
MNAQDYVDAFAEAGNITAAAAYALQAQQACSHSRVDVLRC